MLPRIRRKAPTARQCARRNSSTVNSLYHPKVRAFPFAISEKDAIVSLGPLASLRTSVSFSPVINSVGAKYLPFSNFQPLQPKQIQPVYLPGWFVDAEVNARLWSSSDGEPQQVCATFQNSYMPGFTFPPLSGLSFNDKATYNLETVPFSSELLTQHGSEVTCLPYTSSPLSVPQAIRSLPSRDAVVDNDVRLDPSSVRTNLLAAYPVLLPIYLAYYESESAQMRPGATFILEAFTRDSRLIMHAPPPNVVGRDFYSMMESMTHSTTASLLSRHRDFVFWLGDESSFVQISQFHFSDSPIQALEVKLDDLVRDKLAAKTGGKPGVVDMNDLRVREFTHDEIRPVRFWMAMGQELAQGKSVLERLSSDLPVRVVNNIPMAKKPLGKDQLISAVKDQIENLEKGRETLKPAWLKEWEGGISERKAVHKP